MKVKFLKDVATKVGNANGVKDPGAKSVSFKADQVVDLNEASARHWINRGAAVELDAEDKAEPKKAEPHKPEPHKPEEPAAPFSAKGKRE